MPIEQTVSAASPYVRGIVRIAVALLFLEHGLSRLFGWPSPLATPPVLTMYWFAGMIEMCGAVLFGLGLFTRPVAFVLSGQMAIAFFKQHFPQDPWPILNGGELAVLFCFLWLYLCVAGPGPISLDRLRGRG
jgi:putative oxidoreductase